MIPTKDVFESYIERVPESGCWLWTRSLVNGYGRVWIPPNSILAHRVSWMLYRGNIPEDLCVLHRCDVRCCVNPAHLFLGTNQENIWDMVDKERNYIRKPTHCPRGHILSEDNLYKYSGINRQECLKCKRVHAWASNNNSTFDYALDVFRQRGLA